MKGHEIITTEYGTINDVTTGLNISRSLIYSLESKGILKFRRLGGKIYLKWSEIKQAIDDSCRGCK